MSRFKHEFKRCQPLLLAPSWSSWHTSQLLWDLSMFFWRLWSETGGRGVAGVRREPEKAAPFSCLRPVGERQCLGHLRVMEPNGLFEEHRVRERNGSRRRGERHIPQGREKKARLQEVQNAPKSNTPWMPSLSASGNTVRVNLVSLS